MAPFFGSSRRDQVHLLSALESLGSTSVSGLAAALSWSVRKTDRCLQELVGSAGIAVTYNRATGTVGWGEPSPPPVMAPTAEETVDEIPSPRPPEPGSLAASATSPGGHDPKAPAGAAPQRTRCPVCHSNLAPTGGDGLGYCVACGRLIPTASAVAPIPGLGPAEHKAATGRPASADGPDRRAQEMFAAYVTSRPIPCPRCRKSMRHQGPGSYICPACGEKVKFPTPELPRSGAPATPPPSRLEPPPTP